eukprot:363986-Chlamydomonas_euryale.AAC.14
MPPRHLLPLVGPFMPPRHLLPFISLPLFNSMLGARFVPFQPPVPLLGITNPRCETPIHLWCACTLHLRRSFCTSGQSIPSFPRKQPQLPSSPSTCAEASAPRAEAPRAQGRALHAAAEADTREPKPRVEAQGLGAVQPHGRDDAAVKGAPHAVGACRVHGGREVPGFGSF